MSLAAAQLTGPSLGDDEVWQRLQLSRASAAVEALRQAGVDCLLLKGSAGLAAGWWKAGLRPLTDVDVLVSPERVGDVFAVLTGCGWKPSYVPRGPIDARRHSCPLTQGGEFLVDIHWFALHDCRWAGADAILWKDALRVRWIHGDVLVPSPATFLVHSAAHGLRKASHSEFWRNDLKALLTNSNASVNWDKVLAAARHYLIGPLVADALEEISPDTPGAIPAQMVNDLRRLPMSWQDRAFLRISRKHSGEPGVLQGLVVLLDYLRTRRPSALRAIPGLFGFLKDRWDLASRRAVPSHTLGVMLWGLRTEFERWRSRRRPADRS